MSAPKLADFAELMFHFIDDRLREHGLLEEAGKTGKPAATGKAGKGKPAKEEAEVDLDSLKEKLQRVVDEVSREKALAALTKFKVKGGLKNLPEAKFEKFNEHLDELLGDDGKGKGEQDDDALFGEDDD